MRLPGTSIKRAFESGIWFAESRTGRIPVSDLIPDIGANSIDVRLSDRLLQPCYTAGRIHSLHHSQPQYTTLTPVYYGNTRNRHFSDVAAAPAQAQKDADEVLGFWFEPGQFYLGSTTFGIECAAPLDGNFYVQDFASRSTIARLGCFMDLAAAFGDYGFNQSFTLEIYNASPSAVFVPVNARVGQVYFTQLLLDPCELTPLMTYGQKGSYTKDHIGVPVPPNVGPQNL
jgi:deoxycytidine triphosphate deaminase